MSADFKTGSNGELLLANSKGGVEEIIYQAANVSVVQNNCIIPKTNFAKYRIFINEDSLITFDWSQFVQEKDIAFDLEMIVDADYVVSFQENITWTMPCAGVSAGKTIVHFERKFGSTILYGDLKSIGINSFMDLTINSSDDVQANYICGSNGLGWNACTLLRQHDYSNWVNLNSGTGEGIWYIDFMRSTFVNSLEYVPGAFSSAIPKYFYIEGSIDKQNWTRLLTRGNAALEEAHLYFEKRGFFRHYRLRTSTNFVMRWFRWHGYTADDELFELVKVMPIMTSNALNGFSITSSGTNDGALYNLTTNAIGNFANFSVRLNGEYWIGRTERK
ncbi:hypothetical protein FACS189449_13400 [Alphaproteobacteria bacterium]|nr:hypothetical protein FACS189449_13400 [Alphaproteobacteria bacterium]